ncbi:MAG: dipeptidase PepV [Bacilli bacterium]
MNFVEIAKKYEKAFIKDAQGLLHIDSTLIENPDNAKMPFGEGIYQSLEYMLKLGESFGFKTKNIDNIAGHIEFGEGKDIIGVLVHVDVVPAVGEWKYPPFSGTVEDGKIYARGALDDKGPAVCALYAFKILKDMGFKPNKRLRLIVGTDEETAWRGIKRYFEQEEMPILGFSPDANFPLIYGEKGIMSLDLLGPGDSDLYFKAGVRYNVVPDYAEASLSKDVKEAFAAFIQNNHLKGNAEEKITLNGRSAHAMEPDLGINAAIKLSQFLQIFSSSKVLSFVANQLSDSRFKTLGLAFSDPEMKDLTVNVAIVEIDKEKSKIGLNLRYPIHWNKEEFLTKLQQKATAFGLKVDVKQDQVPHYVDKNDPLIKTLHEAYIRNTNDHQNPIMTIGGGTYARAMKKGVAFGPEFPNRENVVHQPNEYFVIEDAIRAMAIYADSLMELGK